MFYKEENRDWLVIFNWAEDKDFLSYLSNLKSFNIL